MSHFLSIKKICAPICIAATLFLLAGQPARGLEIIANQQSITFFENGVLGDTTLTQRPERAQPIDQFNARNSKIELKPRSGNIEVMVENDVQNKTDNQRLAEPETEAKRIRAQFPAQATDQQIQEVKNRQTIRLDEFNQRVGDGLTEEALQLRQNSGETDEERTRRNQYQVQLLEDRRNRTDSLEVTSRLNDRGTQELELSSGEATARLREASFVYDPDTNSVLVTTSSGQEKELNHLPDQALARIQQLVTIENTDQTRPEFVIEANEDGELLYKSSGIKKRRFLGLFNRNIPTEVTLNDETGAVNEYEYRSPGVLGNLIDALTF